VLAAARHNIKQAVPRVVLVSVFATVESVNQIFALVCSAVQIHPVWAITADKEAAIRSTLVLVPLVPVVAVMALAVVLQLVADHALAVIVLEQFALDSLRMLLPFLVLVVALTGMLRVLFLGTIKTTQTAHGHFLRVILPKSFLDLHAVIISPSTGTIVNIIITALFLQSLALLLFTSSVMHLQLDLSTS
jgi:hypothetical protein